MIAAIASISVRSLPALGDILKVGLEGDRRVGVKIMHQGLPLFPMWLHLLETIDLMDDIVRHFVRHCFLKVDVPVFGENPRVVAQLPLPPMGPEHAGGSSTQVKQHRDTVKAPLQGFFCGNNKVLGSRQHLPLLAVINGFYHGMVSLPGIILKSYQRVA